LNGPGGLARRPATRYQLSPSRHRSPYGAVAAPGIGVLRNYRRSWLRFDVYAGISVVAYLVPQVMAYTALVGVPPVAGLWTALAALIAYAALGSSRVLSVGPESTVALMAGTAIAPLAGADPDRAVALAAALSLIVGGWCLLGRVARLGVIADLLSQPLLVGYLAGAAVLMVVGQLGKMTGTTVEGDNLVAQLRSFGEVVDDTDLLTLAVGGGTLGLVLMIHFLRPRWPAALIGVSTATVVCVLADLQDHGVAVVGAIPTGLPTPGLPDVTWAEFRTLLLAGLGIAVIAYSDTVLIARAFPAPVEEGKPADATVDPQQEFAALAGVHVAVGLMSGFPVSSSGSRTALAITARARTQLYSLVAAACVVFVLFVAGPLIENLPQASLAAVVFYAASKLVSWQELVRLAQFRTTELLLAVTATLGTVLFGVLVGVGVAIGLSLFEILYRIARPHEGVLGRVPGLAGMHDVDDYPGAQTLPGLVVYRYDAPLFFANVGDMRRRVPPATGAVVRPQRRIERRSRHHRRRRPAWPPQRPRRSGRPPRTGPGQARSAPAAGTGRAGSPDRGGHAVSHPPRCRGGLPVVGRVESRTATLTRRPSQRQAPNKNRTAGDPRSASATRQRRLPFTLAATPRPRLLLR
jgi:SulP family sulfate permease